MCLCGQGAGVIVVALVPFNWQSCSWASKTALSSPALEVRVWQMNPPISGKPIFSELWHAGGGRRFAEVSLMLLAGVCSFHRAPSSKTVEHSSVTKSKLGGKVSFCILPAVIACFSPLCDTVCLPNRPPCLEIFPDVFVMLPKQFKALNPG